MEARQLLGRMGTPEEIAHAALYLAKTSRRTSTARRSSSTGALRRNDAANKTVGGFRRWNVNHVSYGKFNCYKEAVALALGRKIRYGMVGGGPVRSSAPCIAKLRRWTARSSWSPGAFSSDAAKSQAQGEALLLDPERVYASWREMVEKREPAASPASGSTSSRSSRPTTRTFEIAKTFIEAGFHVVCDKPMTTTRRRGRRAVPARQKARRRLRPDAQLHRLSRWSKQARELVR